MVFGRTDNWFWFTGSVVELAPRSMLNCFARVLPLAIRLGNYWTIAVSSYLLRKLLDYYCFVYLTVRKASLSVPITVEYGSRSEL